MSAVTALAVLLGGGIAARILALVVIVRADDTTATAVGLLQLLAGAGVFIGGRWEERNRTR